MKKQLMNIGAERFWLIVINLILLGLGIIFVLESSSVESFNVTQKIQQRELRQLSQQDGVTDVATAQTVATEQPVTQPHVWLLIMKQLGGLGVGIVLLMVGMFLPKKYWLWWAPVFYGVGLVLLLLVFIPPFANRQQGAHRWLRIFGFSFQPFEMVKLFLISFFGWLLSRKTDPLTLVFYLIPPVVLLALQPDFASLVLLVGTIAVMFVLSGVKWRYVFLLGALGLVALLIIMLSASYRLDRVQTFLSQSSSHQSQAKEWHATQLKYAFANGGWFGLGIGNSRQKFGYLPETSSDSIFAIAGEELGFTGVTLIILLYVTYFYLAMRVINRNKLTLGLKLFGYGLVTLLALQTLLHLWAVTGLAPLTGITLPFFSYGSSSLVTSMFITGVIFGLGAPDKKISYNNQDQYA